MILLDTNVLSALMDEAPDRAVTEWLDRQPRDSVWITSVTLMEIRSGLLAMPVGRKRASLTQALGTLLNEQIEGRIASFDIHAAEQAAALIALRRLRGRPVDHRDTMIAGIALATRAALVTRNTAHFEDLPVPVVNPWKT